MRNLKLILGLLLVLVISESRAQDDFDQLLEAGLSDANLLIEGYVDPFMKGAGSGLGSGWYNTAKAHKSFGFDLTISASLAMVPDKDMFYRVADSELQTVRLVDEKAPTIFGPATEPTYEYKADGRTFLGPQGAGLKEEFGANAMPIPMIQLGIGIIKNTDVKIRYVPELESDGVAFKLFGIGIMHDVKQHLPGLKNMKFDIAGFVGYTDITTRADFTDPNTNTVGEGLFDINTLTIQGIISKKMSVLTLYGGLGVNHVRSKLALLGQYDLDDNGTIEDHEKDPIDISFKSGGPRVTAGFMLKLLVLTIHADYTLQEYNTLSAGVGITVR